MLRAFRLVALTTCHSPHRLGAWAFSTSATSSATSLAFSEEVESLIKHAGVVWTQSQPLSTARRKLKPRHVPLFEDASTTSELGSLFNQFATVVCRTGAVPRKEVFETWAAALLIHDHFFSKAPTPVRRVVDVAGGHGLLAWALLLLDDHSNHNLPPLTAFCLDNAMPASADALGVEMIHQWPQLEGRLDFVEAWLQQLEAHPSCLMASVHACAGLSDLLIDTAAAHQVPIALVPCCHSRKRKHILELAENSRFAANEYQVLLESTEKMPDLADRLDHIRVQVLERANFQVSNAYLPDLFSAKTRVILGSPTSSTDEFQPPTPPLPGPRKIHYLPNQMPPIQAKEKFLAKFSVPCQDTPVARQTVQALAGRKAAVLRREALQRRNHAEAPTFHLSVWLPDDNEEQEKLGMKFVTDLAQYLAKQTTTVDTPVQCKIAQVGSTYLQESTARRSQKFGIAYFERIGGDECNAMSMEEAKRIHEQLRNVISKQFPGWECR